MLFWSELDEYIKIFRFPWKIIDGGVSKITNRGCYFILWREPYAAVVEFVVSVDFRVEVASPYDSSIHDIKVVVPVFGHIFAESRRNNHSGNPIFEEWFYGMGLILYFDGERGTFCRGLDGIVLDYFGEVGIDRKLVFLFSGIDV